MKAVVYRAYGSPDVLLIEDVEIPIPEDNEVRIRIHASAVTSTDPIDRKGEPFIARLATGLTGPRNSIPGGVLAGEIDTAGKNVTRFKHGDRVFGTSGIHLGAHAEYISLPEDAALGFMPDKMTFEEAAAICDGALTALPFLRDNGKIKRGQKVLINGASGSIGTIAVQLAVHYGAEVTGVCSTQNVELVNSLGAEHVIDYTREDFTRADEAYDIIFDAVGKNTFARCKSALKPGGIYLTTVPSLAILPQMLWTAKFGSRKAVFAATGLRPAIEKSKDLVIIKELADAGIITSVIDRQYPLGQIAEAHRYVETGHKRGNVVLTIP